MKKECASIFPQILNLVLNGSSEHHPNRYKYVYLVDYQNFSHKLYDSQTFEARENRYDDVKQNIENVFVSKRINTNTILWIFVDQGDIHTASISKTSSSKRKSKSSSKSSSAFTSPNLIKVALNLQKNMVIIKVACRLHSGQETNCFEDRMNSKNPLDDMVLLSLYYYLQNKFSDFSSRSGKMNPLIQSQKVINKLRYLSGLGNNDTKQQIDFDQYMK